MSEASQDDIEFIDLKFDRMGHSDYQGFSDWLGAYCERHGIDYESQLQRLPQPGANSIPDFEVEEGVEGALWHPPDPGPLASYDRHGWMDNHDMDDYRNDRLYQRVRSNLGIKQPEVLNDIMENTLHILGRCNEPENWGDENKQGLVYGMVQSGKTASMINLIASGMRAGYQLFIVLAGDKSSLRWQSQERVNQAFNLVNGVNNKEGVMVHSPTHRDDYDGGDSYMSAFKCQHRLRYGGEYRNIVVIKKNVHLLNRLIKDLEQLRQWCRTHSHRGFDFPSDYRCMIIDDEADYASQDTATDGEGSAVHQKLEELRGIEDFRNCYVAYTATPQACLSAGMTSVGYPKDFFWVLEPYMEREGDEGPYRTTSYLGATEVFNEYDSFLIKEIGRDEWPHHERDSRGKYVGVWHPLEEKHLGGLKDIENSFLKGMLSAPPTIDVPPSLVTALHTHIITNGVRWYKHWRKGMDKVVPGVDEIKESYPHHATMIHLSRIMEHQKMCREVAMECWRLVRERWSGILSEEDLGRESDILDLWNQQRHRSRHLPKNQALLSFNEILPFMRHAIEISSEPIRRDDPQNNYPEYGDESGEEVCFYLINSGPDGMKLLYGDTSAPQVRAKKSAILIGGDILSRGLTIEGLSVSYFGRSAGKETHDTVLQRGRWFGHKKDHIDLIQVFLQRQSQLVFRQISLADYELRIQMKQAIRRGLGPTQVLLQLRNSPYFASTSSSKSKFVTKDQNVSFSGGRAVLHEPNWSSDGLVFNNRRLRVFESQYGDKRDKKLAHGRAWMYRDVPIRGVIRLLEDLDIREDAWKASPKRYASFLKEWLDSDAHSDPPQINVAIWNSVMRRKRLLHISKPETREQAQANMTERLEAIVGGKGSGGKYKGDYFIDKDGDWHENTEGTPDQTRRPGEPILIIFYRLDPNYLTRSLFNPETMEFEVQSPVVEIAKDSDDYIHYDSENEEEKLEHSALTFAAFTPIDGPMYQVGTNKLVAAMGEVVSDVERDVEEY